MTHTPPACTIPCELRDYPEWHQGREFYCVWTLPVRDRSVLDRLQRAQRHLSPWLHQGYRRQAHITLFVCGFEASEAFWPDDFTHVARQQQYEVLKQMAPTPFALEVGGLDSFASAPYLKVHDVQGVLATLREALQRISPEVRQAIYVPHLTVGLFQEKVPWPVLQARVTSFMDSEPLLLPVTELELCIYHADELFGPLKSVLSLPLGMVHQPGAATKRSGS